MRVSVQFYSYFKDLTGCAQVIEEVNPATTLGALHDRLLVRFPKLAGTSRSTLLAVGVDYQPREYLLKDGDEVALFPPVQGG